MENFIITMTYLLIGVLIKRLPRFPAETGNVLNMFVIYVSLPALVLLKIPELYFSSALLVPALMPWVMLALTSLTILLLARLFGWSRPIIGCLLLLVPLGNTSFLGIPMVKAFFGDSGVSAGSDGVVDGQPGRAWPRTAQQRAEDQTEDHQRAHSHGGEDGPLDGHAGDVHGVIFSRAEVS